MCVHVCVHVCMWECISDAFAFIPISGLQYVMGVCARVCVVVKCVCMAGLGRCARESGE